MAYGNQEHYHKAVEQWFKMENKKINFVLLITFVALSIALTCINALVFGDGIGLNITGGNSTNSTLNDTLVNRTIIGKVVYVVKNTNFIDENILLFLDNKNLDVKIITDNKIPMTDFEDYDVILIGKGKLRNINHIPLNGNVILMNNYNADYLGFVKDKVSRYAANSPLRVVYNDDKLKVYDSSSFSQGSPAMSYLYLSNQNVKENVITVAKVYSGGSHYLGDVVAYLEDNTSFSNSSVRRCFYGIIETNHWESDAELLFDNCVDYSMGKLKHDVKIDSTIQYGVNGISIKDVSNNVYLMDETATLECNKYYIISVNVMNIGDLSERVKVNGNIGNINFNDEKIINPVKSKSFSENVMIDVSPGDYTVNVNAMTQNSVDSNLNDNSRQRPIKVVCETS